MAIEKIVVVTRKTRLEGLIGRYNTEAQAKFSIESGGGDFSEYRKEHDEERRARETLRRSLDLGLKLQWVDRRYVPTFLFTDRDLVVTLGQDGLVANTAKYAAGQPIIAVNPDPTRIDGILLPFTPADARTAVERVMAGQAHCREVTLAEARLRDGQSLLAFNDLFIGASSHVSARYRIEWRGVSEAQSSSGVLVSTGAGSTGWLSSVFTMAGGVTEFLGGERRGGFSMAWEDRRLVFVVREPFPSRHSKTEVAAGLLEEGQALTMESFMPSGGVIFSDGMESDFLAFNSGAVAQVAVAPRRALLVAP